MNKLDAADISHLKVHLTQNHKFITMEFISDDKLNILQIKDPNIDHFQQLKVSELTYKSRYCLEFNGGKQLSPHIDNIFIKKTNTGERYVIYINEKKKVFEAQDTKKVVFTTEQDL